MYSNYDYYSNGLTSSQQAGLASMFGAAFGIYLIFVIAIAVIQIIAMWKIFTKAGQEGWKSIIPIYNLVILFKISGLSPLLILVYLASIIPFVGWIACLVITIMQAYYLAKSFGKDVGYMFGLLLVPSVFYMILGFGKAEYVGPYKKEA